MNVSFPATHATAAVLLLSALVVAPAVSAQQSPTDRAPEATTSAELPCCSGTLTVQSGSEFSWGWTGIAHHNDLFFGNSIGFDILRRCTDDHAPCRENSDCANNNCIASCNCSQDTSCEISGPTNGARCHTTLASCTTNTDCDVGTSCAVPFGPPLPVSAGGTPLCMTSFFDSPLTGTLDSATGEISAAMNLKLRMYLGILQAQPCPRCGKVADQPKVGQQYTCEGGALPGAACTVDAVSPAFGGTSYGCPPSLGGNITGSGLAMRLGELTTGASTRTAQFPCANFFFTQNPLKPGTLPKCTDKTAAADPVCTSNADCMRCTGEPTIACTNDGQCSGKGSCEQAPEQPVTCGYWCHCGFCDNDPNLPCFETGECPDGQTCVAGTGSSGANNSPQSKPNDCGMDKFICGMENSAECANTIIGRCSLESFRMCTVGSDTCETNGAGVCVPDPRSCFEPRIAVHGHPSPLGSYCAIERKSCAANIDCAGSGDSCLSDALIPEMVAPFCSPATSNNFLNSILGVTGPATLDFKGLVEISRCEVPGGCGDGVVDESESCDDGNSTFVSGEYCGVDCVLIPCGKPTNSSGTLPKSSDALYALRAAVAQVMCNLQVCDVDGSGKVLASDALRILRAAVGQTIVFHCPAP